MSYIQPSQVGETPFQSILGHCPKVGTKWNELADELTNEATLSAVLKEEVRRVLAYGNKCRYCMAKGAPTKNGKEEDIQLATAFAELFLTDRSSIREAHFTILRSVFSEEQIVELCAFICFTTASQLFGAMVDL
ncbi:MULTISPECIES: carboxymuconolactone decarboxylase family protein [Bacillaceae]|uniref:Carboxymuconolactone decarboxylase family protein n=1 Tax=Alkalicoccobacillus plakortidis TaxID=444060 RepID=A0A9D5DSJ1_9BACI|nr:MULTISPECIES: carboxymuconolactone decarboxylase family protein [Bacillaceae]KQL56235.1 hypothetical protein AN965_15050 [Alkalicoccobacillus plakortidis]